MAEPYTAPELKKSAFHCPHCGAYASQWWSSLQWSPGQQQLRSLEGWSVARCSHCVRFTLWCGDQMWFPSSGTAPLPNPDLPTDVGALYTEAREIASKSPRGAAALLRLAVQMLTSELCARFQEKATGDLNKDIGILVKHGLPSGVQEALDAVRVIGNNAVHPGQIDVDDNPAIVASLFGLVNIITEKTITEQKEIAAIYAMLPEPQKQQIEKRDKSSTVTPGS